MSRLNLSKADVQMSLATLLAGSGWLFSIKALEGLPPLLFIGSRFVLAGVLIAMVVGRPILRLRGVQWMPLFLSSLAMSGAMIGWIIGLKHTTHVGVAAFITATGNLIVPFVGLVLFRWPIERSFWISFPVAIAGLSLLFLDRQSGFEPGHVLFMGSAILWAISVAIVRNATISTSPSDIAVIQLGATGLVILVFSFGIEGIPSTLPSVASLGWFLASVILSTCLRFVLQFEGQRGSTPARAALLMIFEPVWAMAFALVFFGTAVSMLQAVGCTVILAAVTWDAVARGQPTTLK